MLENHSQTIKVEIHVWIKYTVKYSYKRSKQSINLNTFSVISFKICIVHILLKGYAYNQNRDHFGSMKKKNMHQFERTEK